MVTKLVNDLTTDTSEGLKGFWKEMNTEPHFTAGINSCWGMVRPRLGLGIAHNHAPAEGVPSVFRRALFLIEAFSLHLARVSLSRADCKTCWEAVVRSIPGNFELSLARSLTSSSGKSITMGGMT